MYKFVLQKRDYDCGVAAAATLLLNSGSKKVNYEKLAKDLKLSSLGVLSSTLWNYFSTKESLKPHLFINATLKDIKSELAKGRVCLIMYQGWGDKHEIESLESGHYAVAVEIKGKDLYLLDPSVYEDWGDGIGWRKLNLNDFKKRWVDIENGKIIRGWMLSVSGVK